MTDYQADKMSRALKAIGEGLEWIAVGLIISTAIVSCEGITVKHEYTQPAEQQEAPDE